MIKGISSGQGLTVMGGSPSLPYINMNNNNPLQGMVRVNGSDLQVFDGSTWMTLTANYATVSLDAESQDLLQWARTQRQMDLNRKTLMANNPALERAYQAVKRAEANFDILSKFVEHDHDGGESVAMQAP